MHRRRTSPSAPAGSRRRPPVRRPGLYLGMATAGAVVVHMLIGAEPAAEAGTAAAEPVSVAEQLGLAAGTDEVRAARDLQPLADLAASRSSREAAQTAAQQAQAAADQAELDRRRAAEDAAARAAAAAAEAAAAAAAAVPVAPPSGSTAAAPAAATTNPSQAPAAPPSVQRVARITNTAGPVEPQVQAAADAVVSDVPGVAGLTLGGTRASAADPGGHPSGLALDYMVLRDADLGDAVVAYHRAHWAELGVDYLIWQQRMLSSPNGSWQPMADRGSPTANHMDHVHVNYRG